MQTQRQALRQISNPPNPWDAYDVDWVGEPPAAELTILEDRSRSILASNSSPDIPFRYSLNPYRGCQHACAYCYARPSHQHLGLGAGTDFDRTIVVKPMAPELLEARFLSRGWRGEPIVFSGNTDCYQPIEASYELTRACLQVCLRYRNPVAIITKSALIERDAALLAELAAEAGCQVTFSVPYRDAKWARAMEPGAPTPKRRLKAMARLSEAGVPVGVMMGPLIPGLGDAEIVPVLTEARAAGAQWADRILLRLPPVVDAVFERRVRVALPLRAERILSQLRDCRGGALANAGFGNRMRGMGPRWQVIAQLFDKTAARLGYEPAPRLTRVEGAWRRPSPQLSLL